MPCACRPLVNVVGSVPASPAIISEKNTPMLSAAPVFWKVARMPDAAPRWAAGTLLTHARISILTRADALLYASKRAGRNRITTALPDATV